MKYKERKQQGNILNDPRLNKEYIYYVLNHIDLVISALSHQMGKRLHDGREVSVGTVASPFGYMTVFQGYDSFLYCTALLIL